MLGVVGQRLGLVRHVGRLSRLLGHFADGSHHFLGRRGDGLHVDSGFLRGGGNRRVLVHDGGADLVHAVHGDGHRLRVAAQAVHRFRQAGADGLGHAEHGLASFLFHLALHLLLALGQFFTLDHLQAELFHRFGEDADFILGGGIEFHIRVARGHGLHLLQHVAERACCQAGDDEADCHHRQDTGNAGHHDNAFSLLLMGEGQVGGCLGEAVQLVDKGFDLVLKLFFLGVDDLGEVVCLIQRTGLEGSEKLTGVLFEALMLGFDLLQVLVDLCEFRLGFRRVGGVRCRIGDLFRFDDLLVDLRGDFFEVGDRLGQRLGVGMTAIGGIAGGKRLFDGNGLFELMHGDLGHHVGQGNVLLGDRGDLHTDGADLQIGKQHNAAENNAPQGGECRHLHQKRHVSKERNHGNDLLVLRRAEVCRIKPKV